MGSSSSTHPCHICDISLVDINRARGYDIGGFNLKGPTDDMLSSIHRQKGLPDNNKDGSVRDYGYRYSETVRLVGYNPAAASPVDPLHNSFLGLVMSFVNMLYFYRLLTSDQAEAFVAVLTEAVYPGHLGRIPDRIGSQLNRNFDKRSARKRRQTEATQEQDTASVPIPLYTTEGDLRQDDVPGSSIQPESEQSSRPRKQKGKSKITDINRDYAVSEVGTGIKADTWKRIAQLLPVALYAAWKADDSHEIMMSHPEDVFYPVPANSLDKHQPADPEQLPLNRNRRLWYQAGLALSAGLRVLHAHHLSYEDAVMGTKTLSVAANMLLSLGAHLTINWHLAMHYSE